MSQSRLELSPSPSRGREEEAVAAFSLPASYSLRKQPEQTRSLPQLFPQPPASLPEVSLLHRLAEQLVLIRLSPR